ncbi:MAG: cell wall metabolism sensor histidine kinase WalK, partial [Cyclobacteriaceae bacterium]|nr:cell wall metabolism sensor histidine kinase WalK [Cyclobacteriaceae bacterium]
LLLTLILAGVSIYYLENVGQASERILEENYSSVKASEGLIVSLAKVDQILAKICLGSNYNEEILLEILEKEKVIFSNNLDICKTNISEVGERSLVNDLVDKYEDYEQQLLDFKTTSDRVGLYFSVLQRKNEVLREACEELIALNHSALSNKDKVVQNLYFNAKVYVFLILILVLLISGLAIYKFPQLIVKPILDVTEKIKRVSEGDYEQQIPVDSDTELGNLSKAFNIMSVKLKEFEESNLEQIKAQKTRIETIIKSINDGLVILNEDKDVILANNAASEILGIDENRLIGQNAVELAQTNSVMQGLIETLEQNGSGESNVEADEEQSSKNFIKVEQNDKQEFFTKDVIDVQDVDDHSKSLGYILLLKNVTYFKQSDEAKTNFIAVASHEFKTPLSAINMCLMLLQDKRFGSLNPEQDEIVASMKSEVQRLIKMVSELLDISKMETGSIELDKKLVSPKVLMDYSSSPFDVQLSEKNITLEQQIDPGLPDFLADTEKISWVLINFLSNAIRYTPEGGTITIEANQLNGNVEFAVKDRGPGIPKHDLNKVFQRFVQLKTNGKKNDKGLGLGLAISKEVITEHHGEIGVESEEGVGSRFYFTIPLETV